MKDFLEIVKTINAALPLHSMWDGFWVHSFKRNTLIISCSFDRTYYRDYDLVFKKVIFFNVPAQWRDTSIHSDDLLRLATPDEFHLHHPGFDVQHRFIFAIDIYFTTPQYHLPAKHTFFILAAHIYLLKCTAGDNNPVPQYADPYEDQVFPCMMNRVGATLGA